MLYSTIVLFFSLSTWAADIPAKYISQVDQSLTIQKVGIIGFTDNQDDIYSVSDTTGVA